jgi:hypothetical protein
MACTPIVLRRSGTPVRRLLDVVLVGGRVRTAPVCVEADDPAVVDSSSAHFDLAGATDTPSPDLGRHL